jgi:hypothetical protein
METTELLHPLVCPRAPLGHRLTRSDVPFPRAAAARTDKAYCFGHADESYKTLCNGANCSDPQGTDDRITLVDFKKYQGAGGVWPAGSRVSTSHTRRDKDTKKVVRCGMRMPVGLDAAPRAEHYSNSQSVQAAVKKLKAAAAAAAAAAAVEAVATTAAAAEEDGVEMDEC